MRGGRAWAMLLVAAMVLPVASAAREHWAGAGPGYSQGHLRCSTEFAATFDRDGTKWDVTLVEAPVPTRDAICLPRILTFENVEGSSVGGWDLDVTTPCGSRFLHVDAVGPLDFPAGVSTFRFSVVETCASPFTDSGYGTLAMAARDPMG